MKAPADEELKVVTRPNLNILERDLGREPVSAL